MYFLLSFIVLFSSYFLYLLRIILQVIGCLVNWKTVVYLALGWAPKIENLECRDLYWHIDHLVRFSFVCPTAGDVRLGNFYQTLYQTCLAEHVKKWTKYISRHYSTFISWSFTGLRYVRQKSREMNPAFGDCFIPRDIFLFW